MSGRSGIAEGTVRLSDIAQLAGVSTVTVGKVLNQSGGLNTRVGKNTREKIERIASQLNYHRNYNASVLAGRKSGLYGVLMDSHAWYRTKQQLVELEYAASRRNKRLLISFTHDNFDFIQSNFLDMQGYGMEGIICISHDYPDINDRLGEFLSQQKNMIYLGEPAFATESPWIEISFRHAFVQLLRQGLELGKQRPALLHGAAQWIFTRKLIADFRAAMQECGLDETGSSFIEFPEADDFIVRAESVVSGHILPSRNDLLFCNDAADAIAIRSCLHKHGVSEADMPLICGGTNSSYFSCVTPQIPSFNPGYDRIAGILLDEIVSPGAGGCRQIVEAEYFY